RRRRSSRLEASIRNTTRRPKSVPLAAGHRGSSARGRDSGERATSPHSIEVPRRPGRLLDRPTATEVSSPPVATGMAFQAGFTHQIEEGPEGPAVGAFFDVDGTLIAGFSAVAFVRDRLLAGRMSARDIVDTLANTVRFQLGRVGFSRLIAATAAWLRD